MLLLCEPKRWATSTRASRSEGVLRVTSTKCHTVQACGAENITAEKKKPSEAYRAFPRACGYLVPLGFVPVVVCSTILIMTYAERKSGVPIGYGFWAFSTVNCLSKQERFLL